MTIFDHNYLYSAYADNTTFFLKGITSIKHKVDTFLFFSYFLGLKSNLTKSEIASIGVLKGVQVAVCGMCRVDLNIDTLKIFRTYFCYSKKLKEEKNNFKTVTDMQREKIWTMRKLTLDGKIVSFKTIAVSKIVFQSFITTARKHIVNELEKMQTAFSWNKSSLKILI